MLYDKVCEAEEHQNAQTHMYILNEDSITVLHSSDKEITKKMRPFIDQISAAKELSQADANCLYENHEILVSHQVMTFGDGSKDAVMFVKRKKHGKIIRSKTWPSPLKN